MRSNRAGGEQTI